MTQDIVKVSNYEIQDPITGEMRPTSLIEQLQLDQVHINEVLQKHKHELMLIDEKDQKMSNPDYKRKYILVINIEDQLRRVTQELKQARRPKTPPKDLKVLPQKFKRPRSIRVADEDFNAIKESMGSFQHFVDKAIQEYKLLL